jgi:flagellar basal-body rod protein FlgG
MLRSLSTAGQGMLAQQLNIDVISNNLANVNTTGFKKERLEFKDMLYETMQKAYMLDGGGKPVNLQVGLGVAAVATVKNFATGNFEKTDNPLDFAIEGEGFFKVKGAKGDTVYTRDASFKVSLSPEGNKITTSEGYPVLDENDQEILLNNFNVSEMIVSNTGEVNYLDKETGSVNPTGQKFGLVKFQNKFGLESIGNNFYGVTTASGAPVADGELGERTTINQNFLEASNVQVVEEMIKLIVAQRAYDVNSKSIQTADDMLNTANNLKR